jgi:hypothetical protein
MRLIRSCVALLTCLSLIGACSDPMMEDGSSLAADAGTPSFPDATPSLPDASPPADAEPAPDDGEDFPIELACSLDEVQPIFECVAENCLDSLQDGTLATCVALSCGLLFLTLPAECSQCILTGLADPSMALDSCVLGLDDLGFPPAPPAP